VEWPATAKDLDCYFHKDVQKVNLITYHCRFYKDFGCDRFGFFYLLSKGRWEAAAARGGGSVMNEEEA
jgi:hypothetical protein